MSVNVKKISKILRCVAGKYIVAHACYLVLDSGGKANEGL